jgi:hypothetical protein
MADDNARLDLTVRVGPVEVGAANATVLDSYDHFLRSRHGSRGFLDIEPAFLFPYGCFHGI